MKCEGTRASLNPIAGSTRPGEGDAERLLASVLAGELDLTPIRFEQIVGVSQKAEEYPVFRLVLQLRVSSGEKSHQYDYPTDVIGVPSPVVSQQQHFGLLGRDFLQAWRLVYDGPSAVVEFEIKQ